MITFAAVLGVTLSRVFVSLFLAAVVVTAAVALHGGRLQLQRSVVVHATPRRVWAALAHLPTLHARHGRSRQATAPAGWHLRRGDGTSPGSVWRLGAPEGRGDRGRRVEFELLDADPGRALTYRMARASARGRWLERQRSTLRLEALEGGKTRLSYRLEARGRTLRLRRLADPDRLRADLFDLRLRSIRDEVERSVREQAGFPSTAEDGPPAPRTPEFGV